MGHLLAREGNRANRRREVLAVDLILPGNVEKEQMMLPCVHLQAHQPAKGIKNNRERTRVHLERSVRAPERFKGGDRAVKKSQNYAFANRRRKYKKERKKSWKSSSRLPVSPLRKKKCERGGLGSSPFSLVQLRKKVIKGRGSKNSVGVLLHYMLLPVYER